MDHHFGQKLRFFSWPQFEILLWTVFWIDCLVEGGEGMVWFSVCGAPLDDWANGDCLDDLVTCVVSLRYGVYGFNSLGNWSYSGNGYGV